MRALVPCQLQGKLDLPRFVRCSRAARLGLWGDWAGHPSGPSSPARQAAWIGEWAVQGSNLQPHA